jgi:hypothetical protein
MRRTGDRHKQNQETGDCINDEEFSGSGLRIMRINFIMLNIVGLLPPDRAGPFMRFIYKVFIAVVMFMEVVILLGQLIAVIVHWGNLQLIANTMCIMNGFAVSFISCTYFLRNKTKILMLIDLLRDKFVSKTKSKYIKIIKNAERQIIIYLYLSSPVVGCCCFFWAIAPFLNRNASSNTEALNVTKTEHNFEKMIFIMWTPFDIEQSPQFEIIRVLQVSFLHIGVGMVHAVGVLFKSLMSHSAAQFKVLVAMLNDMHENIGGNELPITETVFPPNSAKNCRKVINNVTVKHNLTDEDTVAWNETDEQSRNSSICLAFLKHFDEHDNSGEDEFQQYLVNCIKYHESVIK